MSNFTLFRELLSTHTNTLTIQQHLFVTDVDKDIMWNLYLDSFPAGTNKLYRERREYDCACCRHFVKSFGNVVAIINGNPMTIWDFDTQSTIYQPVVDALAAYVKAQPIKDVFVSDEQTFGTHHNFEMGVNGEVVEWDHFYYKLPRKHRNTTFSSVEAEQAHYRDNTSVFRRAMEEIQVSSVEAVLDLIAQNSLYKGKEWESQLNFLVYCMRTYVMEVNSKSTYCWVKSLEVGATLSRIRNSSIGTLLVDLSEGIDLDSAVTKYEKIVAPTNYKRPKAIFTQQMLQQAQKTVQELGIESALGRRHAVLDDMSLTDILFSNRDEATVTTDIFSAMAKELPVKTRSFDKVEEVSIDTFIQDILPRTKKLSLLLESRHTGNLVSVIAPLYKDSKPLFKWNNGFSWAYNGNITDSIKQNVKKAGGDVDGVFRFSLQWNDLTEPNRNDYDIHCVEPGGNTIYFHTKSSRTRGKLDVDIVRPITGKPAVENITWSSTNNMSEGIYTFLVHNYTHRGGTNGFITELVMQEETHTFEYRKDLRQSEKIIIARVHYSKQEGFKLVESIDSLGGTITTQKLWGVSTNTFYPVTICMTSPNYWQGEKGIGNKHYFFILNDCRNDTQPNGFFNEFVREELLPHKRVFEALGSKMKVEASDNQLSGLGFSTTQRNSVICKVEGHVSRVLKVIF